MAERVVDDLEAIKIHEGNGERCSGLKLLSQNGKQLGAIGKAGERVMVSLELKLGGESSCLGHVFESHDESGAVLGDWCGSRGYLNDPDFVAAVHSQSRAELGAAVEQGHERLEEVAAVLGMDVGDPTHPVKCARRNAEHFGHAFVDPPETQSSIGKANGHRRFLGQQAEALAGVNEFGGSPTVFVSFDRKQPVSVVEWDGFDIYPSGRAVPANRGGAKVHGAIAPQMNGLVEPHRRRFSSEIENLAQQQIDRSPVAPEHFGVSRLRPDDSGWGAHQQGRPGAHLARREQGFEPSGLGVLGNVDGGQGVDGRRRRGSGNLVARGNSTRGFGERRACRGVKRLGRLRCRCRTRDAHSNGSAAV